MKSILIILALFVFSSTSYSQANFYWDVTDTVSKTKDEIYSNVKLFVAKSWGSAKRVIENDDKDGGIVLIKGSWVYSFTHVLGGYNYVYNYTVTFKMKDGKYKIIIDNVYCDQAYMSRSNEQLPRIQPFEGDNCPETGTFKYPGPPAKKLIPMMVLLKAEIQSIVDNFKVHIKEPSVKDSDW